MHYMHITFELNLSVFYAVESSIAERSQVVLFPQYLRSRDTHSRPTNMGRI